MNADAQHYIDQHRALAEALPGRGLDWLQAQRHAGLERFATIGFPTQRDENWRYTPTKSITTKKYQSVSSATNDINIDALKIPALQSHRLVFVDGLFAPDLSDDKKLTGVTVQSLSQVLESQPELIEAAFGSVMPQDAHGFTALNNASCRDGAVVLLSAKAQVQTPIEILFIASAADGINQPRNLIIADNGSRASIIERHVSHADAASFTNSATEVIVNERAELDYYLVQDQSSVACQVGGVWAKQARKSRFSCRTITLGGKLVRNDLGVELVGENSHCDMFGLYHPLGAQHVDNHTTMVHAAANCSSREWYKGVLDGRARAVFHGRIVVQEGAQKTDAAQTNNNLLLSQGAEIDTKPQLEIYADDVKCSHGATVGRMDEDALFYLRSRGIDETRARALLTFAFVADIINEVAIAPLKDALENILSSRLVSDDAAIKTDA